MGSLAFLQLANAPTRELSGQSRAWTSLLDLDRDPTTTKRPDAVLVVAEPAEDAVVLGAFQRATELREGIRASTSTILARGSGGAAAHVGPGTIWMQLALGRVDALTACTPDKLLNRYVRPLLRALTFTTSVPVSYFGRDWLSAKHRPVALVGFAHEASSGRALIESIVAVNAAFDVGDRPSFLGKAPATLEEVAGRVIDPSKVAAAIIKAYSDMTEGAHALVSLPTPTALPISSISREEGEDVEDLPWVATREEAIGTIAAGPDKTGRMRIGGELMASRDALARLEDLIAARNPLGSSRDQEEEEDVGRLVDDALTNNGAITFGVRSLASVRDVVVEALRRQTS